MKSVSYFFIAVYIVQSIKLLQKVLEQAHTIVLLLTKRKSLPKSSSRKKQTFLFPCNLDPTNNYVINP